MLYGVWLALLPVGNLFWHFADGCRIVAADIY
jgi:hypothetical protein